MVRRPIRVFSVVLHLSMYMYSRIADSLEQCLPSLETVVLVNNNLEELVGHKICMYVCVFEVGVFSE